MDIIQQNADAASMLISVSEKSHKYVWWLNGHLYICHTRLFVYDVIH